MPQGRQAHAIPAHRASLQRSPEFLATSLVRGLALVLAAVWSQAPAPVQAEERRFRGTGLGQALLPLLLRRRLDGLENSGETVLQQRPMTLG